MMYNLQKHEVSGVSDVSAYCNFLLHVQVNEHDFVSVLWIVFLQCVPFIILQASKKGVSATQVGFIFALFNLVNFVTAPIFGKYVSSKYSEIVA